MLWRRRWQIGLAAAVIAGIVFRLIWLPDVEYKSDEAWTFAQSQAVWNSGSLPLVGMGSSQGLPNPGASLWLFIAISAIAPADPLSMTRGVEITNVIGLLFLAFFVWRCVPPREREPWAWSLALVSVNPFAVLFSRKIWSPDMLPPFTMLMLAGWWYRGRRWGAALWGFVGALLGQIHMGGFFFAAAFFVVTLFYARQGVRWGWWLLGSVLGSVTLLPWIYVLITQPMPVSPMDLTNLNPLYFFYWVEMLSGLGMNNSLGDDFSAFLASPEISGTSTYLALAASLVIAGVLLTILVRFGMRLWRARSQTWKLVFTPQSNTALVLLASFLGYGVFLILTLRPIYMQYMIIDFSLPALSLLWLDRASRADGATTSRRLFATLVAAQAALTLLFLSYIHVTPDISGDYGKPFRAQTESPRID